MTPKLIDSHCHLHFPPYDADRADVLSRMREEGVWGITIGTSGRTSLAGIELAKQQDDVWATVGYHPEHLTSSYIDEHEGEPEKYSIEEIKEIATSSKKVVGIGETGLDFYRIDEDRDVENAKFIQTQALQEHIALGDELNLPLVIHCRDAFQELARVISDERRSGKKIKGVVHCFTGTWEEAEPLLDLGLHLSFTGIITFPPKKNDDPETHVHRVIERMPMERMLVETDAPWLAPVPYRGKQNEPAYVKYVAQKIAELRNTSFDEIAEKTTQNARKLFGI